MFLLFSISSEFSGISKSNLHSKVGSLYLSCHIITDVHDKSYLIDVKEVPFPIVNITTKVDDETNISEVKVTFQRQKSLIPCSV